MAEYRVEFTADSSSAERSIKNLKKEIKGVTKEFEGAEIGAEEFLQAASNLSGLQKELKDARGAVVNIDKAYQDLNKALDSLGGAYDNANKAAENHHKRLLNLAQDSASQEDRLRKKNFQAEVDDFDKRLKLAAVSAKKMSAQQRAIMEFRAGMGAKGAIPAVASPIRGGAAFPGSPEYLEAIAKAAKDAQQALNDAARTAGTIAPPSKAFHPASLAAFESKLKSLRAEARLIAPDSSRWKELNKDILKSERSIERINKRQKLGPTAGQRAGAAGGAFLYGGGMGGGIGSAVGGIAGGLAGGVPGAFAGAAIGQVADNLGTALAGLTSQAAAVQKMQRGLAMASVDAKDFAAAQAAVGEMSQKLLMPLEQTTKYFAQLRANTKEYNLSVAETRQILEGTALAIMATGGSAEDLDGAMRAVVQIMSKGGVQAEELRGQLGERFPGAVVKFAQANKMSFEELQAGLEAGQIGIREFIEFAKKNYTDYAKFSEQLATAPEYAGQRLKMALEQLSLEVGSLFGPMGAGIQDALTSAINGISKFVKDNRVYLRQFISDFGSIVGPIAKIFVQLLGVVAKFSIEVGKVFQGLYSNIRQALGMANIGEAKARLDRAKAATRGLVEPKGNTRGGGGAFRELQQARDAFKALGGQAAFDKANAPSQPTNLTFGGPGAGMSIDRQGEEDKKKKDNLEAFERLRDQLANAYNKAEIERIKAEYELRKRLQEDLYDMQEFGANRLQRQNLQFLRALAKAEQDRQDVAFSGQLAIAEEAGKVAPSTPVLPSAGGAGGGAGGRMSIVDVGKALQKAGFTVKEHPAFGGVTPGVHSPRGYHPTGEAIDVTDWRGGDWKGRTSGLKQSMRGVGFAELLGPGDKGHDTHVHLAVGSGGISQQMFNNALASITGRGAVGAGSPRTGVKSNEIRDTMAEANTGIAQDNAALANRNALIIKGSDEAKAFARYTQESFDIPDLQLSNELLRRRNDLIAAGTPDDVINYQLRLFEIEYQYQDLLRRFPGLGNLVIDINGKKVTGLDFLTKKTKEATDAEKEKNKATLEGIEAEKKRERDKYIKSLQDEIKLLLVIGDEERKLAEIKAQYGEERSQEIFDLLKVKENIEATRSLIGDFVSGTASDYKGFLKAVISGEDAVDALKQFQAGLTDKVLTIFLDFTMAPVEKFFKESLGKLFLPKAENIPGLDIAKEVTKDPVQATNSNTNATLSNTAEIKSLTTAIKGIGAPAAPSVPAAPTATAGPISLPVDLFDPKAATASVAAASKELNTALTTNIPNALKKSADETNKAVPTFQESLGKVTAGIGIAAGAIMGIAAGIGQIKEGGTSNVLGGIGSILMGIGGGIGGIAGLIPKSGKAANGAVWNGGFKAFANGGMVTGPTLGLIGEGRYNEAIVPLPDGRSIPVQMRGGGGGLREAMSGSNDRGGGSPILNMTFQSTNINGVEYVSRDQLEAAMAATRKQAANDGANRGMNMTLDKIRNSPSTRSRVGIR
jgi:tape measure domain-containing protein